MGDRWATGEGRGGKTRLEGEMWMECKINKNKQKSKTLSTKRRQKGIRVDI